MHIAFPAVIQILRPESKSSHGAGRQFSLHYHFALKHSSLICIANPRLTADLRTAAIRSAWCPDTTPRMSAICIFGPTSAQTRQSIGERGHGPRRGSHDGQAYSAPPSSLPAVTGCKAKPLPVAYRATRERLAVTRRPPARCRSRVPAQDAGRLKRSYRYVPDLRGDTSLPNIDIVCSRTRGQISMEEQCEPSRHSSHLSAYGR